jgi:hypothetical protein
VVSFEKAFDMYVKPDAPASIGGVLDSGFKLMREAFGKVVGLAIVASLVSQLPSVALMGSVDPATGLPSDSAPAMGMGLLIVVVISMLVSLVLYGAIVGRMHAVHSGRDMTVGEAFSLGMGCMLPLAGFFILYGLAVVGGSLLLLVPGLILAVSLMFGSYLLIIDRCGVIESLKQSHRLVWGYWWRTTALLGIAGFIMMVAYTLMGFAAGLAMVANPEALDAGGFSLTSTLVTAVLGGLLTPVFYGLTLATFYDLKLRREGEDLASRIDAIPAGA